MNKLAISLAVGTSVLFATAAMAAPRIAIPAVAGDSNIQNVRMVCNDNGRCWRERRVVRESYGYDERRARYGERRGYGGRGYEERGGVGIRVPGVSVGIGTERY
ncbi:MAG: hypothetical protein V7632_793 [Bradyrhizobium sp.]|jgi:hypothetical protein